MQTNSLKQANAAWLESRRDMSGPPVLIAEDSEADVFFILRAFQSSGVKNPVHVVRSGREAMDYLAGVGKFSDRARYPMPGIVFLDLKMAAPDGYEVLRWKTERGLNGILWVAISNFDGVKTINEAYRLGTTTFLAKPLDAGDIRNLIEAFHAYWVAYGNSDSEFVNDFAPLDAASGGRPV